MMRMHCAAPYQHNAAKANLSCPSGSNTVLIAQAIRATRCALMAAARTCMLAKDLLTGDARSNAQTIAARSRTAPGAQPLEPGWSPGGQGSAVAAAPASPRWRWRMQPSPEWTRAVLSGGAERERARRLLSR